MASTLEYKYTKNIAIHSSVKNIKMGLVSQPPAEWLATLRWVEGISFLKQFDHCNFRLFIILRWSCISYGSWMVLITFLLLGWLIHEVIFDFLVRSATAAIVDEEFTRWFSENSYHFRRFSKSSILENADESFVRLLPRNKSFGIVPENLTLYSRKTFLHLILKGRNNATSSDWQRCVLFGEK